MLTLSINTMSFPDWSLAQVADFCQSQRIPFIEIRVLENHLDLPTLPDFSTPQRIEQSRERLLNAGVQTLAINTGFHLQDDLSAQTGLLDRYAALAQGLGAPYLRFFSGGQPHEHPILPRLAQGWQLVEERLARFGVTPVIETHDSLVRSADILALNQLVQGRLNVLWDFAHTTHHGGETWLSTWQQIGPLVRYLHIKDSILESAADGSKLVKNVLPGQGALDLPGLLRFLAAQPADFILSLEWEKLWDPTLPPGELALQAFLNLLHTTAG